MKPGCSPFVGFLLLLLAGATPVALAQIEHYDIPGVATNEQLGYWVSGVGDVNGDGLEDFAAGGAIAVRVYSGADASPLHVFPLSFANTVGGVGDLNGNGYDDIIVGAPYDSSGGFQTGTAVVYEGQTGAVLWQRTGTSDGDRFGFAVAGVGDVNADGFADFAVGVSYDDAPLVDTGSVYVYFGPDGVNHYAIHGTQATARLGSAVAGAGDVDGDGLDDIIVGQPLYEPLFGPAGVGAIRVYRGYDGFELFSREGDTAGEMLGLSVSAAGDIDGDGYGDVIAGAPFFDAPFYGNAGRIWIFNGPNGSLHQVTGPGTTGARYGTAVLGVGDRDGDGKGDLVISAPGVDGLPHRYSAPDTGITWTYGDPGSYFGRSLGKADVNGDGRQDTIIGKPEANGDRGGVEVWLTCVRSSENYGNGWPGTQGIPSLTLDQPPVFGTNIAIQIGNSLGYATFGYLGWGLAEASTPTNLGGMLLIDPFEVIPVTIPAGGYDMPATVPPADPIWCHLAVYAQVFQLDHNATHGWSMTPGLKIGIGSLR